MISRIISTTGSPITTDEVEAVRRVCAPRTGQTSGVYTVEDKSTGVLVEYHPHKQLAFVTSGGGAAGYAGLDAQPENQYAITPNPTAAITVPPIKQVTKLGGITTNYAWIVGSAPGKSRFVGDYCIGGAVARYHRACMWVKGVLIDLNVDLVVPNIVAPYAVHAYATAISNDGRRIVGYHQFSRVYYDAFVCDIPADPTAPNTIMNIPLYSADYTYNVATAISADGQTVVGQTISGTLGRADPFKWTQAGGTVLLPTPVAGATGTAAGISATGDTIVGTYHPTTPRGIFHVETARYLLSHSPGSLPTGLRPFVWRSTGACIDLGTLPGHDTAVATAISDDGLTVVGYSGTSAGYTAFRWTEAEGMVSLGMPIGDTDSFAVDVNRDGSRICGRNFIWTKSGGFIFPTPKSAPVQGYLPPDGTYYRLTCLT